MNLNDICWKKYLFYGISIILMVAALWWSFYQWRSQRMSTNWTGPFLSAAQHLQPGTGTFLIDQTDVKHFMQLDDVKREDAYEFRQSPIPQEFNYHPIGYAYFIKAATLIFPYMGDQLAIILLQCLVHVVLCLCVLLQNQLSFRFRILFLVLYALNPLVLRFVTFNLYYFWQIIPSFWLLFIGLKIKDRIGWAILLLALPFVFLARSTTAFVIVASLVAFVWYKSRVGGLVYSALFIGIVLWLYVPNQKNPWHTFYAGVGGFANPYGISLSDDDAYALYQKHTGVPLSSSVGGNFYDPAVQEKYTAITRQEYLAVLHNSPFLLLKNAVVYFFASFGPGYMNKAPDWINYFVSVIGLAFFLILLFHRKILILAYLILGVGSFVFYYPPIQAYMYGNFLLLVWGLIEVTLYYFPKRSSKLDSALI